MAVSRLLEYCGAQVVKDCVNNDRGVHICRAIFGYLVFGRKNVGLEKEEIRNGKVKEERLFKLAYKASWQTLLGEWVKAPKNWWQPVDFGLKSDHFNSLFYVLGSRAYEGLVEVQRQVEEILLAWEAEEPDLRRLWRQIIDWSLNGYEVTYKRIGSEHDWVWHESHHYKKGKEIVKKGLKRGIFIKSQGAIVTNLSKYGLPDTPVVKSDGTALYITQDLALTKLKKEKFPSDLYIWDIGNEQTLYFNQLFALCEELGIGKRGEFFHLGYELINFKGGGKMSSRKGIVMRADDLLDELHQKAVVIIEKSNPELRKVLSAKERERVAERVGLAAAKYGILKFSRETTIYFDIDESLSLEGNSGPYLQYTYARARSVLRKQQRSKAAKQQNNDLVSTSLDLCFSVSLNDEELALLRTIYQFPEVVLEAAKSFAPNLICNFLFDLAQKFNTFYNRWPIIKAEKKEEQEFRLLLTASVAQILKNGLRLLGIESLEKM